MKKKKEPYQGPWYRDPRSGRARKLSGAYVTVPKDGSGEVDPPEHLTEKPVQNNAETGPEEQNVETFDERQQWLPHVPPPPPPQLPENAGETKPPDGGEATGQADGSSEEKSEGPKENPFRDVDTQELLHSLNAGLLYAGLLRWVATPKGFKPAPIVLGEDEKYPQECENYEKMLAKLMDRYFPSIEHVELWIFAFTTIGGLASARRNAVPPPPPAPPEESEAGDE